MQARTSQELQSLVHFVEGRLQPDEFEALFYADLDTFERLLDADPERPPESYVGSSLFHYVLSLNFKDPGDIVDLKGALSEYLARHGIPHVSDASAADFLNAVLSSQPQWLNVTGCPTYLRMLKERAQDLPAGSLRPWLQQKLRDEFRYVQAPPRWIQSPEWPICGERPLVFLGQLAVRGYFHDDAAVYVFHDPETGVRETVLQVS